MRCKERPLGGGVEEFEAKALPVPNFWSKNFTGILWAEAL